MWSLYLILNRSINVVLKTYYHPCFQYTKRKFHSKLVITLTISECNFPTKTIVFSIFNCCIYRLLPRLHIPLDDNSMVKNEKLIVVQLVSKFPAFHVTLRFVTYHVCMSLTTGFYPEPDEYSPTPSHPISYLTF
jgi:hypothetical protein